MNAIILKDTNMEIEMNEMNNFNEEDINSMKRGGTMWWKNNKHNIANTFKAMAVITMTALSMTIFAVNTINAMNAAGSISDNMESALTSVQEHTYGQNNG